MGKLIGIITAMEEEKEEIKHEMTQIKINKIYDLEFIEGLIDNKKCVLVKCGIGKVNSARTTQILIDNYEIVFIINVGVAGSLNDKLNIGDIVIGENLVQHDFDITAFGHEKGYITGVGKEIKSDENLIKIFKEASKELSKDIKVILGNIASGDIFCTSVKMKEEILKTFNSDCVEMEGASIAQVCKLDKIPFAVIRAISDSPNENNNIDFDKFIKMASKRAAELIKNTLKIL